MFKIINLKITIYYAVFTVISILIITPITRHFLSFMLGFNVFLAYIPMFISWVIVKLQNDVDYKTLRIESVILFIVFVLFLPNTFYIITDLIHIDNSDFYQNIITETYSFFNTKEYLKDIVPYIIILQIAFSMILGIYAGVYSLYKIEEVMVKQEIKKIVRSIIIVTVLFLSSIGIYIGRFLRFFSWEIFNPIKIIKELYLDFSLFTFYFIILFTIAQVILYYTYRSFRSELFEKE